MLGFNCPRVCADGPVSAYNFVAHPLGPMTPSSFPSPWSGTPADLQDEATEIIKQCRSALHAYFSKPQPAYDPEDDARALQMARESSHPAIPLIAVVCRQQIVWNRAKENWPTNRFQFRLFTELMGRAFQFLALVHDTLREAPEDMKLVLEPLLKRLERAAFRVRFVFQELHDLGAVSHAYFDLLPPGWHKPDCVFEFQQLQTAVKLIREWGEDATAVSVWHAETRAKTWENREENLTKSGVPEAVWYRWGNPAAMAEDAEVNGTRLFCFVLVYLHLNPMSCRLAHAGDRDRFKCGASCNDGS